MNYKETLKLYCIKLAVGQIGCERLLLNENLITSRAKKIYKIIKRMDKELK